MSKVESPVWLKLFLSIFALTMALPLRAGERVATHWESLNQLASGQRIRVVLNGNKSYQGEFQSIDDQSILIHEATGDETFSRASILRVSSRVRSHRTRNTLIGTAVGAAAGLGVGVATDKPGSFFPNAGKEILTPLGAIADLSAGQVSCKPVVAEPRTHSAGTNHVRPSSAWRINACRPTRLLEHLSEQLRGSRRLRFWGNLTH